MQTYNPEAIIVQKGDSRSFILTGNVEWLTSETQLSGMLSAGAFIGERSVLTERPASITVRAASFVNALRIPAKHVDFVKSNDFYISSNLATMRISYSGRGCLVKRFRSQYSTVSRAV